MISIKNIKMILKVSQGLILNLVTEDSLLKKKEISLSILVTNGSQVHQEAVIQAAIIERRDKVVSMVMSEKAIIKNNFKVVPNVIIEFLLINYYQSFYMFDRTIRSWNIIIIKYCNDGLNIRNLMEKSFD